MNFVKSGDVPSLIDNKARVPCELSMTSICHSQSSWFSLLSFRISERASQRITREMIKLKL